MTETQKRAQAILDKERIRIREQQEKEREAGSFGADLDQGETQTPAACGVFETSLLEQLKAERARVSRKLNGRIRELDYCIRTIEDSHADELVKEIMTVLNNRDF
jgi:hypothetical protein